MNIPSFIEKQPLYFLPSMDRGSDRVVPADRLTVRPENGALQVAVDAEAPVSYPRIFPVRYRPDWDSVADVVYTMRRGDQVLTGMLPEGGIGDPTARTWFATNDGRVYSAQDACSAEGKSGVHIEQLQVLVAPDWIEWANEPSRRSASFAAIAQEVLVGCGWSPLPGPAIAEKAFATAVGEKVAFAYVSAFDKERLNCSLSGDYTSEGRNALESHGVLLPWDSSAEAVRRLAGQFAVNADLVVGETYAARLCRDRGG